MNRELIESKIKSLVSKFEANKYHYLSKNYLEEEVKIDFINPLFKALGWDVGNTKGLSPFEREVVVEKGETLGRPDYNFRIDGQTKFFMEAKAPHEPLHKINHVLQAKSYAWNTKSVFIVLLTDFEEFRLFDATIKPDSKNADQGLIFELTYDQYLDNLDKLILISKEEVEKGSLDKLLLKDSESRKLRKPVDESFLEDISKWREELAKDIYKNNIEELEDKTDEGKTNIQVKILNEAVQKILDRLIFIRIAEDRKIIYPKSLLDEVDWWKAGGKRRDLQRRLIDRFMGWNQDFNGEILKPGSCDVLKISSGLLAKIIEGLYFPKCPYRFEVMGVELLGSIYERYLGKTIRVTPKRVKIEEKPEVRKAGGVYYTPQYIVDYIVRNTVVKKIKGKIPKQIEKIKILDPACGSGSFLLSAFQTLIDYHLDYYEKHPAESGKGTLFPDLIIDFNGTKRLSIEKKAQILRNNIFGLDIDPQAVEIAMMSLYLKCLEGEKDLPRKKELLPSLFGNLRCGNSLVSHDIFNQIELFTEEKKDIINPFDWDSKSTGFGYILEDGGFDVVIGNPPYVKARDYTEEKEYYRNYLNNNPSYITLFKMWDLYIPFVEKGIRILKNDGLFGMILPDTLEKSDYASILREWLINNFFIYQIDFFPESKIFISQKHTIGIKNTILFVKKSMKRKSTRRIFHKKDYYQIEKEDLVKHDIQLFKQEHLKIDLNRVKTISLGEIYFTSYGLRLNSDKAQTKHVFKKSDLLSEIKTKIHTRKFTEGKHIGRYEIKKSSWLEWNTYRCPRLLVRPTFPELYAQDKLLLGRQTKVATFDNEKHIVDNTIIVCMQYMQLKGVNNRNLSKYFSNIGIPRGQLEEESIKFSHLYILGIINSRLINYYIKIIKQRGLDMYPDDWKALPIPIINEKNDNYINMIKLVDEMINLHKKKDNFFSSKRNRIENQIRLIDEKIDELVYKLYRINDVEKKIVEENT